MSVHFRPIADTREMSGTRAKGGNAERDSAGPARRSLALPRAKLLQLFWMMRCNASARSMVEGAHIALRPLAEVQELWLATPFPKKYLLNRSAAYSQRPTEKALA